MPALLYTTTALDPGAVPNILLDLAPHLRRLGWSIQVLALQGPPQDGAAVRALEGQGLSVHFLGRPAWDVPGAVRALNRFLRVQPVDLVHSHLGRADLVSAWAKSRATPLVTTFHSVRRNYHPLTLWGYRATESRVGIRTGVSQAVIDSFYADGFLRSAHRVIYNPVNPERLRTTLDREAARRVLGLNGGPVLVQVGRLVPVKAHDLTLRMARLLTGRFPGLRVVFVGDGPLRSRLQALAARLGLEDRVVWLGSRDPVPAFVAADVVVFPSRWEGLGLVPIEAMLLRRPVVSADLPAVREFLEPGRDGVTFPVDDVVAFAAAVERALDPDWDLERTRERVLEKFHPQRIAQEYHDVYRSLGGFG